MSQQNPDRGQSTTVSLKWVLTFSRAGAWAQLPFSHPHTTSIHVSCCPGRLWVPHPWRCSRPSWMGPGQPELEDGVPAHSRGWNRVDFRVPSNLSHSVIPCFFFFHMNYSKYQWRKPRGQRLVTPSGSPLPAPSFAAWFCSALPKTCHCYSSHGCVSELSPANGITNAIISTDSPRSFHSITIRFPILAASKSIRYD